MIVNEHLPEERSEVFIDSCPMCTLSESPFSSGKVSVNCRSPRCGVLPLASGKSLHRNSIVSIPSLRFPCGAPLVGGVFAWLWLRKHFEHVRVVLVAMFQFFALKIDRFCERRILDFLLND